MTTAAAVWAGRPHKSVVHQQSPSRPVAGVMTLHLAGSLVWTFRKQCKSQLVGGMRPMNQDESVAAYVSFDISDRGVSRKEFSDWCATAAAVNPDDFFSREILRPHQDRSGLCRRPLSSHAKSNPQTNQLGIMIGGNTLTNYDDMPTMVIKRP